MGWRRRRAFEVPLWQLDSVIIWANSSSTDLSLSNAFESRLDRNSK